MIFSLFLIGCSDKIDETRPDQPDISMVLEKIAEFEKIDGVNIIQEIKFDILQNRSNDEWCRRAWAQACGIDNYTVHNRTIFHQGCPFTITYRLWICQIGNSWHMNFQIIDWKPNFANSSCRLFIKAFNDLYWGGAEQDATNMINAMVKDFGNQIEIIYAGYLAQIYSINCPNTLVEIGFFAADCYKICIDWHYTGEGEIDFGSIIQQYCGSSCCGRAREFCIQNGQVMIKSENKIGIPCSGFTDPCIVRNSNCSQPCDRL